MSRVGKNVILVPAGVECNIHAGKLVAKGKLGELTLPISQEVSLTIQEGKIQIKPLSNAKFSRMMWGTMQRLVRNVVTGVSDGFTKKLEINGVGYRAAVQGNQLQLQLGYSHDVNVDIPADITVKCEKPTAISISGIDRQRIGQFSAIIRNYRRPEPYKGKGVRYENEFILRKEGKKK